MMVGVSIGTRQGVEIVVVVSSLIVEIYAASE